MEALSGCGNAMPTRGLGQLTSVARSQLQPLSSRCRAAPRCNFGKARDEYLLLIDEISRTGQLTKSIDEKGVSTSLRRLFAFFGVNECYRDVTPTMGSERDILPAVKAKSEFTTRKGIVLLGIIAAVVIAWSLLYILYPPPCPRPVIH